MKKLLRVLVVIVVVVVAGLAAAWLMIDSIAQAGIEKGATFALGVDTTVDKVSLSLLNGEMIIDGLTVGNPEGFETPHLMKSGRFDVRVDPATVFGDAVRVTKFELAGLDVYIEQKVGQSNVSVIMANLKRFESPGEGKEEEAPKADRGGKKVQVDRILITDVVAHVQLLPVGGKASTLTVKVPKIELKGVTSDNAAGVAVSELTARLVPAVMAAIVEQGGDVLPKDLAKNLSEDIAGAVEAMGQGAAQLVGQTSQEIGKAVEGAAKGLGDALKGILGGKKEPGTEDAPK